MFPLGRLVMTATLRDSLSPLDAFVLPALIAHHAHGDWGDLADEDRAANDRAVANGDRILSAYQLPSGQRLWIITEADRSSTCLLLPSDY